MSYLDQLLGKMSEDLRNELQTINRGHTTSQKQKRAYRRKTAVEIQSPQELSPSKRKKIDEVEQLMEEHDGYECCNQNCFNKFSLEAVQNCREKVHNMNRKDKKKYIYEKIIQKDGVLNKTNKFNCEGQIVCQNCFVMVYGISRHLMYNKPRADLRIVNSPLKNEIVGFLEDIGRWHEAMPDLNEIHLPYTTKKEVFEMYIKLFGESRCTYTYFISVWKSFMKHIKIRKVHRFSKCGKCIRLKERISESSNAGLNKTLKKKFRKHVNKQLLDREIYEVNIKLAEVYPEEYFSIAIDGANFQRFGLPFFSEKDKDSEKGYKIPISLNGVKVHGHGCLTWIFPSNLPKDPNCTIHCLQETFSYLKDKYEEEEVQ